MKKLGIRKNRPTPLTIWSRDCLLFAGTSPNTPRLFSQYGLKKKKKHGQLNLGQGAGSWCAKDEWVFWPWFEGRGTWMIHCTFPREQLANPPCTLECVCKKSKYRHELRTYCPVAIFYLFNLWAASPFIGKCKARFQIKATEIFRIIWESLRGC